MVIVGWSPVAAQTVLAFSNADQRRAVGAVGELRLRLEDSATAFSGDMQRISARGYDIYFRLSAEGAEMQSIKPRTDVAWKT